MRLESQLVIFALGSEDFGVPIDQVKEIIRFTSITSIPKAPPAVLGVINLRDSIIPVISLRERFGFPIQEIDNDTRIVVSDVGGQIMGFVVDAVTEVLRISDESVQPPPGNTAGVDSRFISGIGRIEDRLVIVLDLAQVTAQEEK
jgi:purine-binding chemotaxis protein CheW